MEKRTGAVLLAAAVALTSGCSARSATAAAAEDGDAAISEVAQEYTQARQENLIGRAYAEGIAVEGMTFEDLDRARDGAVALREDFETFRASLEAIDRPGELDDEFEGALEMVDGIISAAARAEEAGDLEEFTTAYDGYLEATGGEGLRELRAALDVEDMAGLRIEELFEVTEVYSDDLSDETNEWAVPEGVPMEGVSSVDEQIEVVAAPGRAYAAAPLAVHEFDREAVLLSFDAQVTAGGPEETFSYGAACPSQDVVGEGMRAEVGGGGGQTFVQTGPGEGENPAVHYYSYRENVPDGFEPGGVNRIDVACIGVQDRTVVLLWVNGVITTGSSFPGTPPTGDALHGDGALTVLADPEAPAGATIRFDNWTVSTLER